MLPQEDVVKNRIMDHEVFISYSSSDKQIADAVCHTLEGYDIPCWMAPRDVNVGNPYAKEIVSAIRRCKVLVLVFSSSANESEHVGNEIDIAFNNGKIIIPFMVEDVVMSDEIKYYLSRKHWLVAYPYYSERCEELVRSVANVLGIKLRKRGSRHTVEGPECRPVKMLEIEGGTFLMGATLEQGKDAGDREKPVHKVTLSSFSMSETPVTVAQYREFCEAVGRPMPKEPFWGWKENHPIVNVSWYDANAFAEWKGCSLPTESQWEFAARGGVLSKRYKYCGGNVLDEVAWFSENSGMEGTMPVGTKKPNELGLYDMSGNVYEWCRDWSDEYPATDQIDPLGPSDGIIKVGRGGSWHSPSKNLRVSNRDDDPPEFISDNVGFRIVKE